MVLIIPGFFFFPLIYELTLNELMHCEVLYHIVRLNSLLSSFQIFMYLFYGKNIIIVNKLFSNVFMKERTCIISFIDHVHFFIVFVVLR